MPWEILLLPILACLFFGLAKGLKTKEKKPFRRKKTFTDDLFDAPASIKAGLDHVIHIDKDKNC